LEGGLNGEWAVYIASIKVFRDIAGSAKSRQKLYPHPLKLGA